ncbi:LemA family protein [Mycoplasma phocimorsus]|uniref:LemA family protein n=1 Tax=Mycoplasma phocimorsus TaxID=3045839 RepID=UPI0024BF7744|nr:LemA family protein [Mycoplasma phocimorsus]MDJ1648301.1 LemA family protein [Mycoplasma phocimorsus]
MANLYDRNPVETGTKITVDTGVKKAQASGGEKIGWWFLFILSLPLFGGLLWWWISKGNDLKRRMNKINQLSGQIDTQLTKRHNTLTKLLGSVQGYVDHEKSLLSDITKLRNMNIRPETREESTNLSQGVLGRLSMIVEQYPNLKANEQFNKLSDNIVLLEDEIAATRRFYNSEVNEFNSQLFTFPSNVKATSMGLETIQLFSADPSKKQDVVIKF